MKLMRKVTLEYLCKGLPLVKMKGPKQEVGVLQRLRRMIVRSAMLGISDLRKVVLGRIEQVLREAMVWDRERKLLARKRSGPRALAEIVKG